MTIAADLRQIARVSGNRPARATAVSDALASAREVFRQHVTPTRTGGWLFQPGIWAGHPDYAYAGHHNGGPNLAPARVSDIAEDTSHSHRLPLWLTSLSEAYGVGHPVGAYYDQPRHRLATQFLSRVLVPPNRDFPSFRTTNFMDGHNGLYRWGYVTHGPDNGYRPYELSGTLLLGWWSFLDRPGVCASYDDQARRFPLPPRVIRTYIGPDTTRVRHRLLAHGAWYRNGLALQLVRVAADRCREVRR
ncbi:hypothetical protein [Actinoplanes aureus]|uniref:Uncharacterized protein n=1 Tax=Actinoplanes aureus TaxID=2792083 RepID=A0A931CFK7_9ACTN|nr:hypothetical protein [Actinoplanes aureus]MBG0566632.1 hypothetical protein [Actinoplanes aureus]